MTTSVETPEAAALLELQPGTRVQLPERRNLLVRNLQRKVEQGSVR